MSNQKKNNLFDMGASFNDGWSSDNHQKSSKTSHSIKAQNQHQLHLRFEKRKGKPTTLVGLFYYGEASLKELHKKIKKSLACGGSIERDEIMGGDYLVFQGDHREKVKALFEKSSWRFKK